MSYEGTMMGSGIYTQEITLEIVCAEYGCSDCELDRECKAVWEVDFMTDDWGNIEDKVTCPLCKHTYTFKKERE